MSKKQTAVEWLFNEIFLTTILDKEDIKLFKQAKEMEKQQIIDARVKKPLESEWLESEQYYNETFNKDE